ncbi:MAG: permease [Sphingomonas sp. 28-66-16]|nr:MAG: permease [Sphingomonas sp. 28-66-16]
MTAALLPWLPGLVALLAAGLAAGFAAGLFGIGGGFVVVPAFIAILPALGGDHGEYAHVAIGTSLATIMFTSLRSVQAHARRGAVDFDILKSWSPWIVLGVGGGVLLARLVDGHALTLIFAGGVFLMALHFIAPVLGRQQVHDRMPTGMTRASVAGGLGAFSSLLGIGGGTIAVVVMTMCGRSIHRAIATAAGLGFIIAVPGTIGFALIGLGTPNLPMGSLGFVNLPGAAIIASTSMLTAPMGAAAAHSLPPGPLKRVFGLYLLFVSVIMFRNAWFA